MEIILCPRCNSDDIALLSGTTRQSNYKCVHCNRHFSKTYYTINHYSNNGEFKVLDGTYTIGFGIEEEMDDMINENRDFRKLELS